jgi:hypothetical protein
MYYDVCFFTHILSTLMNALEELEKLSVSFRPTYWHVISFCKYLVLQV